MLSNVKGVAFCPVPWHTNSIKGRHMDITGTLAKLLATENLSVVHSASASTAAFDVQNRVLTLPVLNDASQEVMTMFAAHEVGHALQTADVWNVIQFYIPPRKNIWEINSPIVKKTTEQMFLAVT